MLLLCHFYVIVMLLLLLSSKVINMKPGFLTIVPANEREARTG